MSIVPSLIWFGIVLALIPIALAVIRRGQGIRGGRNNLLRVASALALGPRERIAVVEACGQWLVIGITPQSINVLTTLKEPPAQPQAQGPSGEQPSGAFGRLLGALRKDV
jgi:flagellar protein FliO/FliZ